MRAARQVMVSLVLVTGLMLATTSGPATGQTLSLRGAFGNAAAHQIGSEYKLQSTLGQAVIGRFEGPSYDLGLGFWSAILDPVSGITMDIPLALLLGQNSPNPFNPMTRIPFSVSSATQVRLTVHDLRGRLVATLMDRVMPGGSHEAVWLARDEVGLPVAAGIYFYVLRAEGKLMTKKMCVIK